MNRLHALAKWVLRAWPALAIVPIAAFHYIALQENPHSSALVNKLMGMTLQIAGGLIVIVAINQNLGLFRNQSLLKALKSWLEEFPFRKPKEGTHHSTGAVAYIRIGASGGGGPTPRTMEERVEQLERAIGDVRQELQSGLARAQKQLDEATAEIGTRMDATAEKITGLSNRVEHATVGGFKTQAFGVVLVIYGAVTSVYA